MKLLYSQFSPFVRKIRVLAHEAGLADRIEIAPVEVRPTLANPEMAAAVNPARKIPALILADGTALSDSTVIALYLDELSGGRLVPTGPARWTALTDHSILQAATDAAVLIRYETALRPEALRWPDWVDDQWSRIVAALAWFESRPERLEGSFGLVHAALGCFLAYLDLRFADRPWRDAHPRLAAWQAETERRPSFETTKPQ